MIECKFFKPLNKGCLLGYVDVFIPKFGLEINGLKLFQKNGKRWIAMPDREYTNKEGEKKYAPIVCFKEKNHFEVFSEQVKEAVEKWCKENSVPAGVEESFDEQPQVDDELPF